MPTQVPIKRKRGNTRRIVLRIRDDSGDVDITNFTGFRLSVNPSQYPISTDDTVEVMSGYIIDAATGRVGFTPTGLIPVGNYFHDAELIDDNTEKYTFAEGTYVVTQGVTK